MFTGLVESLGNVHSVVLSSTGTRLSIATELGPLQTGDSISVSGACLTVIEAVGGRFSADVSRETLERTTLSSLSVGSFVNLERPATLGSALGGHLVTGHVDAVARVLQIEAIGEAASLRLEVPRALGRYLAEKGSVCLDGVSLTVNSVTPNTFDVMLIPHTRNVTTLGRLLVGGSVNLEIDLVARYVARWLEFQNGSSNP